MSFVYGWGAGAQLNLVCVGMVAWVLSLVMFLGGATCLGGGLARLRVSGTAPGTIALDILWFDRGGSQFRWRGCWP
ncbi:hypothetical protein MO867_13165 [Microbulbifer sp. OS29]|uniref:Uncharacterized protein n=1 Tax=Microbulbifer okhotskensis TaxID=2926617 RepID=A0A9X2J885_9GAMM|nr:hypothetical protein [Microbulbifer okhotskensis]MCO1335281.1 hypothetical protein [Microbulbifer okhotskensis]